jgi:hypothetical protein
MNGLELSQIQLHLEQLMKKVKIDVEELTHAYDGA